jgi:hypothetical protein
MHELETELHLKISFHNSRAVVVHQQVKLTQPLKMTEKGE